MSAAWAEIDLDAIGHNVGELASAANGAAVMAVVKADAYGHGLVPVAWAARAGGAAWLGVAQVDEALALRASGDEGPVLAWLLTAGCDLDAAVAAGIDLSVSSVARLDAVLAAGERVGRVPRLHLKADTGLSRGGAVAANWDALVAASAGARRAGRAEVVAVWSHLAAADEPGHPSVDAQVAAFARARSVAAAAGLGDVLLHLANSAATLTRPELALDIVRTGIAIYGLSPAPDLGSPATWGLRPAMTLRSSLALVKEVPPGSGVSYGHRHVTEGATTLGLVPVGYADGIPRSSTGRGMVQVNGRRVPVVGTVSMDQVVADLGPGATADEGDPVVVWGDGSDGAPTADDWAEWSGTISYEIVTRLGHRVQRRYRGGSPA